MTRGVRIEPCGKRIRVVLAGEVVVDTTRAQLVWIDRPYPTYFLPLADVVVVSRLREQMSGGDERVDCSGCGVGGVEERLAVDLAEELALGFNDRVGPDHLQVEYEPARFDRLDHLTQDVHDVLRIDSSE